MRGISCDARSRWRWYSAPGSLPVPKKADEPQLEFATVGFVLHLPPAMRQARSTPLVPGFAVGAHLCLFALM